MPAAYKPTTGSPTAEFLGRAIEFSGLTQREIARKAGFDRPNIISMMKHAGIKVPLDRIPDLAHACGVDPARFMRIALREYHPEILALVESHVGDLLTLNEITLVHCYRIVAGDEELEVDTDVKLAVIQRLEALRDRRKRRRG